MTTFESLQSLEIRNQRISAGITLTTGAIVAVALALWMIPTIQNPPLLEEPKEEIFEVVSGGGMDYGNYTNGSGNVNNFQAPSETPRDAPPKAEQAAPKATASAPAVKAPPVQEQMATTDEPAEVSAPPPAPKSTPKPVKKEVSDPAPVKKETRLVRKPKANASNSNALFSNGGGSNHGDGTGIGNRGTPESKILNAKGLYSFGTGSGNGTGGEGEGGLNGRRLIYQVAPKYDAQEEGRIRFKITVNSEGEVVAVKAVNYSGQLKLKRAVEESLRKWKFSPKAGGENQVIVVTYTFKLK